MRYTVLYNPHSGNGQGKAEAEALAAVLPEDTLTFADLCSISSYADFFAAATDPCILCGGDGTLNRFINDTRDVALPKELYFFATGSGNDFLTDVGGEKGGKPILLTPYLQNLPEVTINGKTSLFLNNVGFGIDGYCCEVGDKLRETTDKPINYAGIAIKGLLFHFHPVSATVTVDGVSHSYKNVWLAPTMHGRYYGGGMMPTPKQDRLDPERKLSLMVMFKKSKLKTLMVFPSIFKGEHVKHTEMVEVHTGHEIRVVFDRPVAAQIDGETVLNVTEYVARSAE